MRYYAVMTINKVSPCNEKNDSQRLPSDGKHEQSDGRAEGDEGAAEKHRRRHFEDSWGEQPPAAQQKAPCRVIKPND